jgi:hypothetical protein
MSVAGAQVERLSRISAALGWALTCFLFAPPLPQAPLDG